MCIIFVFLLLLLISYLSLIFVILIIVCLGVFLLQVILPGTLCASWTWLTVSFLCVGSFQLFFKYFLQSFLSLSSFWDPYNVTVGAFNVVPEVS